MRKLLSIAIVISMVFTMGGCLSSAYHFNGENEYPYNATMDCADFCLGVWWHEPKDKVENAMDAYTKMVYPFWIVDFPLEIVLDTLWLPVDGTVELIGD